MCWHTLSLLLVALLSHNSASAGTVQEAGLPNPAIVEIVFPFITFGDVAGDINFKTEIEIVNTTERDAYVEFALFDQQGEVPSLDLTRIDSDWDGRYARCVAPGEIIPLDFPPGPTRSGELVGPMFVGWGILRSNENVTVFQRIVVRDPVLDGVPRAAQFRGVANPIQRAEIPVRLPTQFATSSTGIAIVNTSDSRNLSLEVQYWVGRSNPLVDPPELISTLKFRFSARSQHVLLVPNYSRNNARTGFVRLIAAPGQSFAFTALNLSLHDQFGMSVSLPGTYDSAGDGQIHITSRGSWNFDVPIVETTPLRDLEIVLTDFGFFVIDKAGLSLGGDVTGSFFGNKFPGPFHLCGRSQVVASEEAGIAVVGRREKSIVFGDSKKIIQEVLPGTIQFILDLQEQDGIEVKSAFRRDFDLFLDRFVLIDKGQEKVIDRFVSPVPGDPSIVPPWR